MSTPMDQEARAIKAEAAAWLAKLHGPERSAALEADFREWLTGDPRRAAAFERITDVWQSLAEVNISGLPRMQRRAHESPRGRRRFWQPALVAVTLACIVAGVAFFDLGSSSREYATDVGEQRIVTLDDGSKLSLNGRTRVDVQMTEGERRVRLERGEVFFEVAKQPQRPFIVTAGGRTVTALGTSFLVRYEQGRTAVTLVEGKVRVAAVDPVAADTTASKPSVLTPGERLTFESNGSTQLDMPRADATAAWRRGELVLDETPLAQAVEEMNRYQKQPLVLDDEALKELRVSGIYRIGSSDDFAIALAAIHDMDVVVADDAIHLRRKR